MMDVDESTREKVLKRITANKKLVTESIYKEGNGEKVVSFFEKILGYTTGSLKPFEFAEAQAYSYGNADEVLLCVFIIDDRARPLELKFAEYCSESLTRRFIVVSNEGFALFEPVYGELNSYNEIAAVDLVQSDEYESLVEKLGPFLVESQQFSLTTDSTNRKRWYGYYVNNERTENIKVLVHFKLYEESSEVVRIPLLEATIWSNKYFEARKLATERIGDYLESKSGGNMELFGNFETTAPRNETEMLVKSE